MRIFSNTIVYFLAAACLLLIPLSWIASWVIAVAVHELGHYIALRLCGIEVYKLRPTHCGLKMDTAPMTNLQEFICSIAGPISGLALLLLVKVCPRTAICAGIHAVYNLLPIYPLDGGRCMRCFLQFVYNKGTAICVERWICRGCVGVLSILAFVGALRWKLGVLPVIIALGMIFKSGMIKTPCKENKQIVQ